MNSKTFCLAPWVSTCVTSSGKLAPCCNWSGTSDTNFRDFDSWINSDYLQDVRKRMYQGEKISQCDTCWKDESVGKQSLRKIYNLEFAKFSNRDHINKNWQVTDSICTLDLQLGNLCNLKCVMCTPSSSSQLLTEYKANATKFNSLTGYSVNFLDKDFSWPLTDDFKKFLSKFQNQIKWIKFSSRAWTGSSTSFRIAETKDSGSSGRASRPQTLPPTTSTCRGRSLTTCGSAPAMNS